MNCDILNIHIYILVNNNHRFIIYLIGKIQIYDNN